MGLNQSSKREKIDGALSAAGIVMDVTDLAVLVACSAQGIGHVRFDAVKFEACSASDAAGLVRFAALPARDGAGHISSAADEVKFATRPARDGSGLVKFVALVAKLVNGFKVEEVRFATPLVRSKAVPLEAASTSWAGAFKKPK